MAFIEKPCGTYGFYFHFVHYGDCGHACDMWLVHSNNGGHDGLPFTVHKY